MITRGAQPPAPKNQSCSACLNGLENQDVSLRCPRGSSINSVDFASFGTPLGTCYGKAYSFQKDPSCDAPKFPSAVRDACVGNISCTLQAGCGKDNCLLHVTTDNKKYSVDIGHDPCLMVKKRISVAVQCHQGTDPIIGVDLHQNNYTWLAAEGPHRGTVSGGRPGQSDDPYIGSITDWSVFEPATVWTSPVYDPPSQGPNAFSSLAKTPSDQVPSGALRSIQMPLSRLISTVPASTTQEFDPDKNIFLSNASKLRCKFPRNFVGTVRVDAAKLLQPVKNSDGVSLHLKHGEVLAADGSVSFPWSETQQTDIHLNIANKDGSSILMPRFTWHGFQYVEVNLVGPGQWLANISDPLSPNILCTALTGLEMHNALETTGNVNFFPSAHILNGINKIVRASQLSNVAAYQPTDCPTREKHGWLGDAQVTAEEAMMNFHMAAIYTAFLHEMKDAQDEINGNLPGACPPPKKKLEHEFRHKDEFKKGPYTDLSWTAAFPLITRWMLLHYGDTRVVERYYPSLKLYIDSIFSKAKTSCEGGLPDFFTWGDWCAVEARALATPGTGPEAAAFNFILSVDAMAHMAKVLGFDEDYTSYTAISAKLRPVFHQRFYNATSGTYGQRALELQTLTVAPLALDGTEPTLNRTVPRVIPKNILQSVLSGLNADISGRGYHMTVGSVGAKHLLPQLSRNGLHDTAMRVATQTTFPSFGFWLSQNATTCWENYRGVRDASHPPPPTHNHIFLCGGVGEWMYREVAGISSITDGYEQIAISPNIAWDRTIGGPTGANATLATIRGTAGVQWDIVADKAFRVKVQVPVGSIAYVKFPVPVQTSISTIEESGDKIWANGKFVPGIEGILDAHATTTGDIEVKIVSGLYIFNVALT